MKSDTMIRESAIRERIETVETVPLTPDLQALGDAAPASIKPPTPPEPVVTVFIPADENQKNDAFQYIEVGLNGRMYTVARGKPVEIPVPVFEVLKLSGRYSLGV